MLEQCSAEQCISWGHLQAGPSTDEHYALTVPLLQPGGALLQARPSTDEHQALTIPLLQPGGELHHAFQGGCVMLTSIRSGVEA